MDTEKPMDQDRVSLWKLDQLMQGTLPEQEATRLREFLSESAEGREYLAKYSHLRSGLSLDAIRKARFEGFSGIVNRYREVYRKILGVRPQAKKKVSLGFAGAFGLVLGLGVWTLSVQAPNEDSAAFHSKGGNEAGIRLQIQDKLIEPGESAQARDGDTLGVKYRSPAQIHAQIWYREEGRKPYPMAGGGTILVWEATQKWRQAPQSIVLDGDWQRQTVWVVWSRNPFTSAEAGNIIEGPHRPAIPPVDTGIHAEAFRLVKLQP